MMDEMINTVKAALAPGADADTKRQAAGILRGLLAMLESGGGVAVGAVAAVQAPTLGTDLLAAIVEYVRPHLPPEALAQMPRFRVPMINLPPIDKT
jgi:molybdopterin-guanine dinucleotide biosynthesis protein A